MKPLSKIVWAEGMYLGPHHFQAQSRYFEDSLHFVMAGLRRDAYGFSACQMDADALHNGILRLPHARGIFEDGLVFDFPGSDAAPEPLGIAGLFSPVADHLTVSLAVHRSIPDGRNVSLNTEPDANTRYRGEVRMLPDENTGRDEKQIQVGRKKIHFVVDSQITNDLVTLPLVRIVRDGSGHFEFHSTFVPPCLSLSASLYLTHMLRRLVEILEEKSAVFSREQLQQAGLFQAGLSARHVAQYWYLHAINSNLAPLRHFLLSYHAHPEELFREMSRLAGALCTFGLETHPRDLPSYDHREAGGRFQALDEHIRRHLEIVVPSKAITIPLKKGEDYFYQGDITDERCIGPSRWLLGIHSPIGEADLISKVPQLVKVCSSKFVPELVKRALPGLTLTHIQVPPSAVAAKVESQYFVINRTGPCWDHIVQSRKLSAYVPGELPSPEIELVVILED